MKNSLSTTGLSLSQAQSISNLCYQRALEITNKLSNLNNASRNIKINSDIYVIDEAKKLPSNALTLLNEKAKLHATQAFLMTNIKAKDELISSIKERQFVHNLIAPESPELQRTPSVRSVGEEWGWDQLSVTELSEYLESEAYAAHIGQFIHKNGELDNLRKNLPNVRKLEFMEVEIGKKTPINVIVHHSADELYKMHEDLAAEHRKHEQRVNYYKAKVKNLVTEENARIARLNADNQASDNAINNNRRNEFKKNLDQYEDGVKHLKNVFQEQIELEVKNAAKLRIGIDPRFQSVIDSFLKTLTTEE